LSIKKIAAKIGKHPSTVAREICARSVESNKGAHGRLTNRRQSRRSCSKRQLCEDKPDCVKRCSACTLCSTVCPEFKEEVCAKLACPPYVCNGCPDERACVLRKRYYLHGLAQKKYRDLLVHTREGANITEEEICALDALVSPLIRQGQSVHHILTNHPDRFDLNEKTVYCLPPITSSGALAARLTEHDEVLAPPPGGRRMTGGALSLSEKREFCAPRFRSPSFGRPRIQNTPPCLESGRRDRLKLHLRTD
jgi:hypothetical protein